MAELADHGDHSGGDRGDATQSLPIAPTRRVGETPRRARVETHLRGTARRHAGELREEVDLRSPVAREIRAHGSPTGAGSRYFS